MVQLGLNCFLTNPLGIYKSIVLDRSKRLKWVGPSSDIIDFSSNYGVCFAFNIEDLSLSNSHPRKVFDELSHDPIKTL